MSNSPLLNVFAFAPRQVQTPSQEPVDFGGPSGPGGGGGDVLERVGKLESDVAHIQRDVTGIQQKLDRVADDVIDLKVSMATLAGRQDTFEFKLDAMDKKFDAKFDVFDAKLDAMDKKFDAKFDGLDKKFATKEELQAALHNQTKWLLGGMLAIVAGAIGVLKYFGI